MISELNARKIGYEDSMSNRKLSELLGQVNAKEEAEEKDAKKTAERKPEEPLDMDLAGVACGLKTTQNHERRIRIIEHKLGL